MSPGSTPFVPVRSRLRVLENRAEGGANWRLALDFPGFRGFGPGQFAMLSPGALSAVRRSDPVPAGL